jgi:hypothetical protein
MSAKAVRARSSSYLLFGVLVLALVVGTSAQPCDNTCLSMQIVFASHQAPSTAEERMWASIRVLEVAASVMPTYVGGHVNTAALFCVKMAALAVKRGGATASMAGWALIVLLVSSCFYYCFLTL